MRRGLDLSGYSIIPGNICSVGAYMKLEPPWKALLSVTYRSIEFSCLKTVALPHFPV